MQALVVDDQYDVVQGLLSGVDWVKLGFDVVFPAYSADEAINILAKESIDLLLCDIEMPPRSGFDVLQYAREHELALECIFLTAYANFSYAQTALKLGSFDYILQPARYEEITEVAERALKKLKKNSADQNLLPNCSDTARILHDEPHRASDETHPIKRAKAFIRENIYRDLSRTQIAEAVFLNPDYLSRLFKRVEGISLNDFITKEKMLTACALLRQTQIPVGLIATKLGYTNFSYFSQLFKRSSGMTPLEYRQSQLAKPTDKPSALS